MSTPSAPPFGAAVMAAPFFTVGSMCVDQGLEKGGVFHCKTVSGGKGKIVGKKELQGKPLPASPGERTENGLPLLQMRGDSKQTTLIHWHGSSFH